MASSSSRVFEVDRATTVINASNKRIYLALEAMQALHIGTGDLITLESDQQDTHISVGVAWPSLTLKSDLVQLSPATMLSCQCEIGDKIHIHKFQGVQAVATSIHIKPLATLDYPVNTMLIDYIKETLIQGKYVNVQHIFEISYHGKPRRFMVERINDSAVQEPSLIYEIVRPTKLHMDNLPQTTSPNKSATESSTNKVTYEHIGGLSEQIKIVREMVETPLQNPELFLQYGLRPPRGILLYGPPGTGKTLIARAVAQETGAHSIVVNGPEIVSKFYGETEQKLRDLFDEGARRAPTIIFIDEIDALCPKRDEAPSELEKRVVTTLLTLMDGASETKQSKNDRIVVIGATNRPNVLDEALRRPGRFDREVEIGIPNSDARLSILSTIMRSIPHTISTDDMAILAGKSHGYVGADLAAVCREAGLKCIKRCARQSDSVDLRVSMEDMQEAMGEIRPSAMREILLEVPKVYWSDVGGQSEIKQRLKESIEWPLQHPEAFERLGIRPPKGILLYGPPGCSKTLMAKALATEAGSNFIAVKGPELFSKWVGESEKAVREVFRKARAASPSIVFFDEIDALTVKRGGSGDGGTSVADRVLSQLLNELDGIEPLVNVTVVAATNRPDIIDSALLRPGRIDRILYVGPPDIESRCEIFKIQSRKMTCDSDVDIQELAAMSEGCSGAEAVAICQEAALLAMEEDTEIDSIKRRHFLKALSSFTRRITPEMLQFYADFQKRSGLRSL
ncbi:P-loop containing nucleoside triphosphate hydrolase protein [Radiomyces spectabilis]|uniref:P-loop containing nucleoside triphosphate hydrolase protein n=1 Tax=Radiomyces spectabilis TaxID=64574 RepID=UPI002220CA4C|nr:P-loop containing nucleoside triphosphate hydrolase protein [Radiomyces spectabilis]KAI8370560.1 P-loop containing nucleoside triphosphate hydrolase protein [Radiomyces spectabilis]